MLNSMKMVCTALARASAGVSADQWALAIRTARAYRACTCFPRSRKAGPNGGLAWSLISALPTASHGEVYNERGRRNFPGRLRDRCAALGCVAIPELLLEVDQRL